MCLDLVCLSVSPSIRALIHRVTDISRLYLFLRPPPPHPRPPLFFSVVRWGVLDGTLNKQGQSQLVENPTKKPGAILTKVRAPGVARDVFSQGQLPVQDSLTVCAHPRCAVACSNICAHLNEQSQTLATTGTALFGHRNTVHTERVALLLRLLCLSQVGLPEISRKGQWSIIKKYIIFYQKARTNQPTDRPTDRPTD